MKLWEKTSKSEKAVGSTKIPLHQFYVAFQNPAMVEHFSFNQLPVIAFDTWCNFISPLSSEMIAQGKILLAIGSVNQIEYLKLHRNLDKALQKSAVKKKSIEAQTERLEPESSSDFNQQLQSKLSEYIESLSVNIPLTRATVNEHKVMSTQTDQPQLSRTSTLMENLTQTLAQPLLQSKSSLQAQSSLQNISSNTSLSSVVQEKVKISVNIEHACHLPMVSLKSQNIEFEPSAYVTFESSLNQEKSSMLSENLVKSYEGIVHCTKVVKSCDPYWNYNVNVQLPLDILTNPLKRFVVKLWRKNLPDSDMKATPIQDVAVGFSAIDASVLLTGLPILSGYYNIMDFSGRCHGQIKLSLKPLENVIQYQDSSTSLPTLNSAYQRSLNTSDDAIDGSPNIISRTLKRKFTELDEITQRLKARLFDVAIDDKEEEFERDLNTAVVDEENNDWLQNDKSAGNEFDEVSKDYESEVKIIFQAQPSTSRSFQGSCSTLTQRQVSGSSNPTSMAIDALLKKYDLDTLINPSIYKNILDPTLANSDSTPTLNPQQLNTDDLANISGDSDETTVSSIISGDLVQNIQKALQKTSLADDSEKGSSRKDPDGENNFSE